jgi:hypothetical protein
MKELGLKHINVDRAQQLERDTGDWHTIIHREMVDFPDWMLRGLPLRPLLYQVFAISPESTGMIHKDGIDRKAALNIPLSGCSSGWMEWFDDVFNELKIDVPYTKVRLTTVEKNYIPYRSDTRPKERIIVDHPHLVDTDTWHRVDNRGNTEYRFMFSVRFHGNQPLTVLKEIFKNELYI